MLINKAEIIVTGSLALTLNQVGLNPLYSLGFYPIVKLVKFSMNRQKKVNYGFSILRYLNTYWTDVFLSEHKEAWKIFSILETIIYTLAYKDILSYKYLLLPFALTHLIELFLYVTKNIRYLVVVKSKMISKELPFSLIDNHKGVLKLFSNTPLDKTIIPILELCTNSTITDINQNVIRKNIYNVKHVFGKHSEYRHLPKLSIERLTSLLKMFGDSKPIFYESNHNELENEYVFLTSLSMKKLILLRKEIESKFGAKKNTLNIEFEEDKTIFKHKHTDSEVFLLDQKILNLKRVPMTFLLGVNRLGKAISFNYKNLGHCLMVGMTGSGKSTALHMIIQSIMYFSDDIFFYMIDLKGNELPDIYEDFNNCEVVGIEDQDTLIESIKNIADFFATIDNEYRKRIKLFKKSKVKDIESYNQKNKNNKLPYISILIDEVNGIEETIKRKDKVSYQSIVDIIDNLSARGRSCGMFNFHAGQQLTEKTYSVSWRRSMMTKIGMKLNELIQCRSLSEGSPPNVAEKILNQNIGEMTIIDKYNNIQYLQACISNDKNNKLYEILKKKYNKNIKKEGKNYENIKPITSKIDLENKNKTG